MKKYFVICMFLMSVSIILAQDFQKPNPNHYYRLISRYNGTDTLRKNVCIEYFPEGSVHPNMLWTAKLAPVGSEKYNYQLWRFVPSPDNPEQYAMVCKAAPNGYVNIQPTELSRAGRWLYVANPTSLDPDNKYGFMFKTTPTMSGVDQDTGNSYCALVTTKTVNSLFDCMNAGGAAQDYAINLFYETYSEDANEWSFAFEKEYTDKPVGINELISDSETDNSPVYDIYGRRAVVLVPGCIYISRNRKFIAH